MMQQWKNYLNAHIMELKLISKKFISHNAVLDACTGSNPREIDDATMEKLFECTYYGTKVNF